MAVHLQVYRKAGGKSGFTAGGRPGDEGDMLILFVNLSGDLVNGCLWEKIPKSHSGFRSVTSANTADGMATIQSACPTIFGTRFVFPAPRACETMAPPAAEMAWETMLIMFSSFRAMPVTAI